MSARHQHEFERRRERREGRRERRRRGCRSSGYGVRLPLRAFILRWSDAQARFKRRDPRVKFGKLLLHGLLHRQDRLLQIFLRAEQLFQLLDALTLDVR